MIIIAGTVDVDPAQREAALKAARPHMQATRAQKGCLHYTWAADELVEGRIYVYELWDNAANLELHFAGPHYLNMRNTIGAHGLRGADVLKYEIGRTGPVYDAQMKPRADFF